MKGTRKEFEAYLNLNKQGVPASDLRGNGRKQKYGSWLRREDPIMFSVAYGEWFRDYYQGRIR